MSMTQLNDKKSRKNTGTVRTCLVKVIAGNETSEAKVLRLAIHNDTQQDFEALREHYE